MNLESITEFERNKNILLYNKIKMNFKSLEIIGDDGTLLILDRFNYRCRVYYKDYRYWLYSEKMDFTFDSRNLKNIIDFIHFLYYY